MQQSIGGDRPAHLARAAMAVVLVGAALRLAHYVAMRSLWLDEAMLANNILGKSFGALLGPLDESQNAPWLFLFGERAAALTLGPTELALRLLPLLAGIALPWMVWLTAKRLADDVTAIVAAAIVALSPLLLYYANEVKPYGIDALVCTALVFATLRVLDDPTARRRWLVLVLGGAAAILAAFPATFVLAACWGALLTTGNVRQSSLARRMLPLAAGLWAATFAAPYLLVIRRATDDAFLTVFFSGRFLIPWRASALPTLWRLWHDVAVEVFLGRDALARVPGVVAVALSIVLLALCGAGLWEVRRRRGAAGVLMIAGPMLMALAASTLRVYPLSARLWAFSAPFWAILAAAGLRAGVRAAAEKVRAVACPRWTGLAAAGLLATAGVDAVLTLTSPYWRRAHMRPLIRLLEEEQRRTGDPIYVMARAVPQWLFYTTAWWSDPAPGRRDAAARWLEQRTCTRRGDERARTCQLVGAYTSQTHSEVGGFGGTADSAWADREVTRLRNVAAPCGWVLLHMPYPGEPAALARAVGMYGGYVKSALDGVLAIPPLASRAERMQPYHDAETKAFRICFDGDTSGT